MFWIALCLIIDNVNVNWFFLIQKDSKYGFSYSEVKKNIKKITFIKTEKEKKNEANTSHKKEKIKWKKF